MPWKHVRLMHEAGSTALRQPFDRPCSRDDHETCSNIAIVWKRWLLIFEAQVFQLLIVDAAKNCFFGATAATLHSFPYTPVATITEHVFPFVRTYPNGTIFTEFSTSAELPVVSDPHLLNGPTFSHESQMTWTTLNYSMAYPSTYVQYLGFEKDAFSASPTIVDGHSICSGEKSPTVLFDNPTPAASYIYPLTVSPSTTTSDNTLYFSVPVPTNIVDHIESLASESSFAPYTDIQQCADLRTSYVNFNGPIDAPTLTLCDTSYSTHTLTSSSTCSTATYGSAPAYPTHGPDPSTSISTILHCSFGQASNVAIKAGVTPGIAGVEWQIPYTTVKTTVYTVEQSSTSSSSTKSKTTTSSTSTHTRSSSTRSHNSSSVFATGSGSRRSSAALSQHV